MSNKDNSSMGVVLGGFGLIFILIMAVYSLTAARFQGSGTDERGISELIAPVGRVDVAGAEQAAAAPPGGDPAPAAAESTPAVAAGGGGEEIYKRSCIACHAAGVAGAPKLGDKAAWEPRIALGMDALMTTVLNGKNAMPPRGTCATCTDDELKATVEYMISQAQ